MSTPAVSRTASLDRSFGGLLIDMPFDAGDQQKLRREISYCAVPLLITTALLCVWSVAAPLSGAVIAPAEVKVELNRKTVQHQEGGIVRDILVRNGQTVRAGDPLIVIGDVRSNAELSLLQSQIQAERIRNTRATAEASLLQGMDMRLAAGSPDIWKREQAMFVARRRTLDEQVAALELQINEAQHQAVALQAQIDATDTSATLSNEELALNEKLVREGFVPGARILQLKRAEADYRSKISETRSELALARQRAGDLKARIAQARNQYQQVATDEIKESSAKLRELEERLRPSLDQVERQLVRSPVDGAVMGMRVAAVGEVIGPREAILDVVPSRERLVIEAHIRPQDITHVRKGGDAEVRLTAFDARTTPLMPGKVVFVSADRVVKPDSSESWYTATVEVDASSLKDRPDLQLQAGMPAELFVTTPERTLFQYLTRPFSAFAEHAMREP